MNEFVLAYYAIGQIKKNMEDSLGPANNNSKKNNRRKK